MTNPTPPSTPGDGSSDERAELNQTTDWTVPSQWQQHRTDDELPSRSRLRRYRAAADGQAPSRDAASGAVSSDATATPIETRPAFGIENDETPRPAGRHAEPFHPGETFTAGAPVQPRPAADSDLPAGIEVETQPSETTSLPEHSHPDSEHRGESCGCTACDCERCGQGGCQCQHCSCGNAAPAVADDAQHSSFEVTGEQSSTGSEQTAIVSDEIAPDDELRVLAEGGHGDPHSVLGQHQVGGSDSRISIRARRPMAETVTAILASSGERVVLQHVAHGIWAGEHEHGLDDYELETTYASGVTSREDDPYRFIPSIGELDLYLFGEGRHEQLWHVMGAHVREHHGTHASVTGTSFTVWAPRASAVRVIGSFNDWDGTRHQMRRLGELGVWELFVPGVEANETYKFQIRNREGFWVEKADPMARHTEHPPQTASVIEGPSQYSWGDDEWMRAREERDPHTGPMSIYEMHLKSWGRGDSYRAIADELIAYLDQTGFTHVEFMPLSEHPFGGSWGYQVTGYYAPTSRLGSPDELRYLVDRLHQAGYGVIMDWVPGHFPKDEWALGRFDGEPLYEHPDPRRGEQPDWGTYVFDFGRPQVRNFLVANALFWLEEFHIDGLRVDAVASMLYLDYSRSGDDWLPNEFGGRENLEAIAFLQEANATAYRRHPGIAMIAEESTAWPGVTKPTDLDGLGFGLKWNMGWMNDTLRYIEKDPLYRTHHHGELTFSFVYAWSERYILPISHDEVVHGKGSLFSKMPGDAWRKFAGVRAYLAYMWGHPGKQLLFMGQEFAQEAEWNESRGLDWWLMERPENAGIQLLVSRLNALYREHPALWALDHDPSGFQWINGGDVENSILSFIRRDANDDAIVMVFNFSAQPLLDYRIGVPRSGTWGEILNTDDEQFGGSGKVNASEISTEAEAANGLEQSISITVPPLGAAWFRHERD